MYQNIKGMHGLKVTVRQVPMYTVIPVYSQGLGSYVHIRSYAHLQAKYILSCWGGGKCSRRHLAIQ